MRRYVLPVAALLSACNSSDPVDEYNTTKVTLPDGTAVRAEVMRKEEDMRRGMMFRDTFPEGRGMLFVHGSVGKYSYWMYQVKVPLDIVWLDSNKNVVEISENTPPCKEEKASECPSYGGTRNALVVLELPGGYAKRHGVREGAHIEY
jgi:uncharacterized membrane protein (UPF0127 family)